LILTKENKFYITTYVRIDLKVDNPYHESHLISPDSLSLINDSCPAVKAWFANSVFPGIKAA